MENNKLSGALEKFNEATVSLKNFIWIIAGIALASIFYNDVSNHIADEDEHAFTLEWKNRIREIEKVRFGMNERDELIKLRADLDALSSRANKREIRHQDNFNNVWGSINELKNAHKND